MVNRIHINRRLQSALDFSEADLIANRAGCLTDHQRQRVLDSALKQIERVVSVWAVLLVLYALIPVPQLPDSWVLGGVAAVAGWAAMKAQHAVEQFEDGKVAMLEGVLVLDQEVIERRIGYSHTRFYLRISGETFRVGESLFECFVERYRYRVFFTADSKYIMSAEFLD